MAKQITIPYEDKEYTLEYNRKAIQRMERSGFRIGDLQDKPGTSIPQLFQGAFYMHHRSLKTEVIDDIYANLEDDGDELMEALGEMYQDALLTMIRPSGNIKWEKNW